MAFAIGSGTIVPRDSESRLFWNTRILSGMLIASGDTSAKSDGGTIVPSARESAAFAVKVSWGPVALLATRTAAASAGLAPLAGNSVAAAVIRP